jgi:hypothetical protein
MDRTWRELLDAREEKKWDSFSWTALRALVASLNHVLNVLAPRLIGDIRSAWLEQTGKPKLIDRSADTAFVVLGDPGEQDASQFVVVPALREEMRGSDGPAFMVICSDVIYPSGDINDYVDGFYVPYADIADRPVYALPGNHDWYDGLTGFMWHFCGEQPRSATVYGGSGSGSVVEWVFRLLWRRPSKPKSQLQLEPRRKTRFPDGPLQQTPYFAIDTKHVRLVCIDTGITGMVDKAQAEWLLDVSADGKDGRLARPKVLLTGKPLLVDRVRRRADLEEPLVHGDTHFTSVDEIVRLPDHRYVAAIGGDIHNFQHYDDSTKDWQFHYVVSGGGGAYMSATHPLVLAGADAPVATHLYPDAAQSLIHFARLLLPRVWRLFRALLLLVLGILGAAAWVWRSEDADLQVDVLQWTAVGIGAWLLGRSFLPPSARRTPYFRFVVCLVAFAAGVTVGLAGWWLAPTRFGRGLAGWAALTAGGATVAVILRITHWWRPAARRITLNRLALALIVAGLAAATAVAFLADAWLGIAAAATAVIAIATWIVRARTDWWSPLRALMVAIVVQLADAIVVLDRWVVPDGAHRAFWAAAAAVPAGLVLLAIAVFVALPAATFVVAFFYPGKTADAWGRLGGPVQTVLPFIAAGVLLLAALLVHPHLGTDPWRAAVIAGVTVPAIVGAVFLLDWTRRHARWSLSAVDAVGVVAAALVLTHEDVIDLPGDWPLVAGCGVVAWLLAGSVRHVWRANAYKQDIVVLVGGALAICWTYDAHETWVPRAVAAGAVVLIAMSIGIALAHLFFIGVPTMLVDCSTHREREQFNASEADQVLRWRETEPSRANRPGWRVRLRANIVFPGENRPHGPLQQKVAEVFDSDEPPFAKNFLVITTTERELTIRMRPVTGDEPGTGEQPKPCSIRIPL